MMALSVGQLTKRGFLAACGILSALPAIQDRAAICGLGGKLKGEGHEIRKTNVRYWYSVVRFTGTSRAGGRAATSR